MSQRERIPGTGPVMLRFRNSSPGPVDTLGFGPLVNLTSPTSPFQLPLLTGATTEAVQVSRGIVVVNAGCATQQGAKTMTALFIQ